MRLLRPLLLLLDLYRYVLCIVVFLGWLNSMSYYMSYSVTPPPIPTTHTVFVQFLNTAKPSAIEETYKEFKALKKNCVNPGTHWPYIKSLKGGRNLRTQWRASHAFITEFKSTEDRDYYLEHDPAHKAFQEKLKSLSSKTMAVDFHDGEY